jgi:hypothetical protein
MIMTVTRAQALTANVFHEDHEPAGKIYAWRRNGRTQTWVTRPDDFRVPIKYGLKSYDQITAATAMNMHAEEDCPTRHVRVNGPGRGEFFGIVVSGQYDGQVTVTVQVTTRGESKHRVGSRVDVPTVDVMDLGPSHRSE